MTGSELGYALGESCSCSLECMGGVECLRREMKDELGLLGVFFLLFLHSYKICLVSSTVIDGNDYRCKLIEGDLVFDRVLVLTVLLEFLSVDP